MGWQCRKQSGEHTRHTTTTNTVPNYTRASAHEHTNILQHIMHLVGSPWQYNTHAVQHGDLYQFMFNCHDKHHHTADFAGIVFLGISCSSYLKVPYASLRDYCVPLQSPLFFLTYTNVLNSHQYRWSFCLKMVGAVGRAFIHPKRCNFNHHKDCETGKLTSIICIVYL